MTLAIYAYTAFYRFTILFIPSKIQQKYWGRSGEESPMEETKEHYDYCALVSKHVNRVSNKTEWESKCLVRALTARRLLMRKNITCTLYLGVGKNEKGEMVAHAWLRSGQAYVTGGNGKDYATVAKYAN